MNELFTKFVRLLRQKVSMKHHVSSIEALHRLHPKVLTGEKKCVGIKSAKQKVSCVCFSCRCQWKRGAGPKRQKEKGQLGKEKCRMLF